jgi:3-deoxy-7-phosphoheptulonate synthase
MLCERGIRTYETATRNTMDISAIPVLKKLTHLPVFGDPVARRGHSRPGSADGVGLVAAGADGLLMEMHPNPDKAMSDGAQSLFPEQLGEARREAAAAGAGSGSLDCSGRFAGACLT